MFLKSLTITSGDGREIRNIPFHGGLNLIIDETPIRTGKETGNNVGKTTVLKLIDFCLDGSAKGIYTDSENQKNEHKIVKDFLVTEKVLVSLVLIDDLSSEKSREILIQRNFLRGKSRIQRVNGENKTDEEFEHVLTDILFPDHYGKKPTFRQIISHNVRYEDQSVNNTVKTLDVYTRDDEYEALYLFLLGCDFDQGNAKQLLRSEIKIEEKFKARLESEQTRAGYETILSILETEIKDLEVRKARLNLNPNLERDLNNLNGIKYQINLRSYEISRLELRRNLILEAEREIKSGSAAIDMQQLRQLYGQVKSLVNGVQKTFEDLTAFHNRMVDSKIRFIVQDLPRIDKRLTEERLHLSRLLAEEVQIGKAITQSDSFEVLEQLIGELNSKFEQKGRYENLLHQLNEIDSKLRELNKKLSEIDDDLFSDEFSLKIKEQVRKFNQYFSAVSNELYGEKYVLKAEPKITKGRRVYQFTTFNLNFSSGKKQGEIVCFDIAYTLFADAEGIPCMHFLLNDKKELMHDNQLIMIAKLVNEKGIQFVASILKDKLPQELNKDQYIVLRLSQEDKLFRIENAK